MALSVSCPNNMDEQIASRDGERDCLLRQFSDMLATVNPGIPSAGGEDGKFFADERNNVSIMAEEEEIPVPIPPVQSWTGIVKGVGAFKVLQFDDAR